MAEAAPRLVIGVGNLDRGDDAVGRLIARQIAGQGLADVTVVEEDGEPAHLIAHLAEADAVWLVDAALSGATPGIIHRIDAVAGSLPKALTPLSTHGFGLAEAIELARRLKRLPRHCIIYAIEIEDCTAGAALTAGVAAAVDGAVARLSAELRTELAADPANKCQES